VKDVKIAPTFKKVKYVSPLGHIEYKNVEVV